MARTENYTNCSSPSPSVNPPEGDCSRRFTHGVIDLLKVRVTQARVPVSLNSWLEQREPCPIQAACCSVHPKKKVVSFLSTLSLKAPALNLLYNCPSLSRHPTFRSAFSLERGEHIPRRSSAVLPRGERLPGLCCTHRGLEGLRRKFRYKRVGRWQPRVPARCTVGNV